MILEIIQYHYNLDDYYKIFTSNHSFLNFYVCKDLKLSYK